MHYRPRAIPYKPPIQPNQARKQTKIAPHIWAYSHILEHQKETKIHQWKAKNLGMEYLPVGDEQQRETESKNAKNDDPRAASS